jgi:hypothetical protein
MTEYTTRNVVELKVGAHRSTQLELHLRTCDIKWFNENRDRNMEQILSLVSRDIIPQICDGHYKQQNDRRNTVEERVGSKVNAQKVDCSKSTNVNRKSSVKTTDEEKMIKKRKVESSSKTKTLTYIPALDTKYLFGDTIQLTYRIMPNQSGQRAILSMKREEDNQLASFEYLKPLPKNIVMWCYPFDPLNPKHPTMDNTDGFPRMEFIPLSSLFKESSH